MHDTTDRRDAWRPTDYVVVLTGVTLLVLFWAVIGWWLHP